MTCIGFGGILSLNYTRDCNDPYDELVSMRVQGVWAPCLNRGSLEVRIPLHHTLAKICTL